MDRGARFAGLLASFKAKKENEKGNTTATEDKAEMTPPVKRPRRSASPTPETAVAAVAPPAPTTMAPPAVPLKERCEEETLASSLDPDTQVLPSAPCTHVPCVKLCTRFCSVKHMSVGTMFVCQCSHCMCGTRWPRMRRAQCILLFKVAACGN